MNGFEMIEPQYLLLAVCAGFAGLSMFIYAIVSFGMREKTYEEALAEQKARDDKEKQEQHDVKQQRRRQFADRRKKEKTAKPRNKSPRQKPSREAVEEEERPYSEEEPIPTPPQKVTPRQEKEKKKKPAPAPQKAPEKPKVVEPPVIKPTKAKKTEAAPPPPPPVIEEVVTQVIEEPVMAQRKAEVQAAAPPPPKQDEEHPVPSKSKKIKHTGPAGDTQDAPMKGKAAVNAVKNATLKPAEIQQIMEILVSKQGGEISEDWVMANQRADPSSALKKQLQEKEQALHKEMLLSQSNMQNLKEAKAELVQEKSRTKDLESQAKNKMDMQTQEMEALRRRMQQTHEQHSLETQGLQTRMKQMQSVLDESNIDVVKQLREENTRLKNDTNHAQLQKEQIMGAELARLQGEIQKMKSQVAVSESKLRQANDMKNDYDTRIANYESQIAQLQSNTLENSSSLTARLQEMTEEVRKSALQNRSLGADLENSQRAQQASSEELQKAQAQLRELLKAEDEKKALMAKFEEKEKDAEYQRQGLETKVRAIESQLKDNENIKQDTRKEIEDAEYQRQGLETKVRAIESQLKDNENIKQDMRKEIENLKLEKTNLENQLAVTEQRSEAEGQEEPSKAATNGDIGTKDVITLTEHQALLQEKQDSLDKLQLQITSSTNEITKLQEEIEKQKKKNNTLRERNHTAMDALQSMEEGSEEKLKKTLRELKGINGGWSEAKGKGKMGGALSTKEIAYEEDELGQQLHSEQKQSKATVQRIFPEITANQALAHKDWLSEFEQKAIQFMKQKEGSKEETGELTSKITSLEADCKRHSTNIEILEVEKGELNKNVAELQYERKQLVSQCDHYQSVLGDTEGMLNKLQSSVELEEQKWEEKLASTEKLLQQAKAEVKSLQGEVSSLKSKQQTTLDITSSPDHMESDLDDTSDYQRVVDELAASKSTIDQLTKNRQSVAGELDDVKKQLTQLKNQLEAANQRAGSNTASPEVEELKRQVSASNSATEKLTADLQAANSSIADLKQALQQKESAVSEANNNSNARVTELQKELDSARAETSKLKEELAKNQNGAPPGEDLETKVKEIEKLTTSLKDEQKLKKDLGVAAGRLQQMLKKNQVLLENERKTSNQLRAELGKEPEAEVNSSLTDSQVEEELAEALQESIKLATKEAAEAQQSPGGTSV